MSFDFSKLSAQISREIYEEKNGMTDALRLKLLRCSFNRPRKITPKEYKTLCAIYGDPDENGRGWLRNSKGQQVIYSPDKIWCL